MSAQTVKEHGMRSIEETLVDKSVHDHLGIDDRYEPVVQAEPVSGYAPIVDAWVRMLYPINATEDGENGIIKGKGSRHARQFPDGSGVYETTAGSILAAVRLTDGTIIWNSEADDIEDDNTHWPWGAETRDLVDAEMGLPFEFVGEVLTQQTDLNMHDENAFLAYARGEESYVDGELFMRGAVRADIHEGEETGILIEHKSGAQVYVGWDSTSHRSHQMFGFCPFDGAEGTRAPTALDALDLLRPEEALDVDHRQGEYFFVPTDDDPKGTIQKPGLGKRTWRYFAGFTHDEDDLGFETRHDAIGEATKQSNHPRAVSWVTAERGFYTGSPLDSHIPRDWRTKVSDGEFIYRVMQELEESLEGLTSPQDVFDAIYEGRIDLSYERARELAGGIYVRGTVRHRRNDHEMARVADWRKAVTHSREVLSQDGRHYHLDC